MPLASIGHRSVGGGREHSKSVIRHVEKQILYNYLDFIHVGLLDFASFGR